MKILQLTHRVPYPPTDGGSIGVYTIVKGLCENNCKIDLVSINTPKHSQPKNGMTQFANQFDVFVDTGISPFKLLRNVLFKKTPYNVERFYTKDVEQQLNQLLEQHTYDIIQLEGTFVLKYIDSIRKKTTTPIIVRAHNVEYVIWERLSTNEINPINKWFYTHLAKRLKRFESDYYNRADAVAAITEKDKNRLRDLGVQVQIDVIPVGVVLDNYLTTNNEPRAIDHTVFILGALDWLPNIEGVLWFVDFVWPKVLAEIPDAQLHIAGKSPTEKIMNLVAPNTIVHGFVDDALRFMKTYNIMLVPLLSGGGMRVKIIEGLAAGKCIISTAIGAEGISYTDTKNIIIANTAEEWKDAIVHCMMNPKYRKDIESEARILASHYDNHLIAKKYIALYANTRDVQKKTRQSIR